MSATPHRRTSPLAILIAAWLLVALATTLLGSAPRSVRAADPTDPATPTPTPSPTGPTLLEATITFHGRGYGHGVGMSQHGARGRALAGQTAEEILAHYYQGATLGEIALDTPIRVRVLRSFRASSTRPLVLFGRGGDWTIDGIAKVFPKDAKVTVTPTIVRRHLDLEAPGQGCRWDASPQRHDTQLPDASGDIGIDPPGLVAPVAL